MKDKDSIQKHSSNTDRHGGKGANQKDNTTNSEQKLDVDRSLHNRAAKRSNYNNDGPGGGYAGL